MGFRLALRPLHVGVLALISIGASCANFSEKYYFRSQSPEAENPLYYRVNIRGHTLFSKSRYSAGFFDKAAVEDLFGEVGMEKARARSEGELEQEKSRREAVNRNRQALDKVLARLQAAETAYVTLVQATPQDDDAIAKARAHVVQANEDWRKAEVELGKAVNALGGGSEQVLDPTGRAIDIKDKRFVLFMNSNSDALARALQKIAEEEQVVQSLVALANGDLQRDVAAADRRRTHEVKTSRVVASKVDDTLTSVAAKSYSATVVGEVQAELLTLMNRAAGFQGAPTFQTVAEAHAWIEANAGAILGELAKGARQ